MRYLNASIGLLLFGVAVSPLRADVTLQATLTGVASGTLEGYLPNVGNVYVGQLNWQQQGTYNTTIGNVNTGTFNSFCIEVKQDVNIGGQYTYTVQSSLTNAPVPGPGMSLNQANEIRRMWYFYDNGDSAITGTAADKAAAFQIAIWKILYTDPNTGATTTAYPTSISNGTQADQTAVTNDIHEYYYNDALGSSTNMANLVALTCGGAQDQITECNSGGGGNSPFTAMPVPHGIILMFSGIVPMLALMKLRLFSGR